MNLLQHKNVLFGHKWRISAAGIAFNNLGIIDLFSYKVYEGPLIRVAMGVLIIIPGALIVHLYPKRTLFMLLTTPMV